VVALVLQIAAASLSTSEEDGEIGGETVGRGKVILEVNSHLELLLP
jgi:hypothetical protein